MECLILRLADSASPLLVHHLPTLISFALERALSSLIYLPELMVHELLKEMVTELRLFLHYWMQWKMWICDMTAITYALLHFKIVCQWLYLCWWLYGLHASKCLNLLMSYNLAMIFQMFQKTNDIASIYQCPLLVQFVPMVVHV